MERAAAADQFDVVADGKFQLWCNADPRRRQVHSELATRAQAPVSGVNPPYWREKYSRGWPLRVSTPSTMPTTMA
jgi:hypothetical protein